MVELCSKDEMLCPTIGIIKVFDDQNQAKEDILYDAKKCSSMRFFGGYDPFLCNAESDLFALLRTISADVKILLVDTDSEAATGRLKKGELGVDIKAEQRRTHVVKIKEELSDKNPNIKLKLHNEFIRNKFFIFDNVMYLAFRLKGASSEALQMWKVDKECYLYKAFNEQFDDYWKKYGLLWECGEEWMIVANAGRRNLNDCPYNIFTS